MAKRFNWDNWEHLDDHRSDDKYLCSSGEEVITPAPTAEIDEPDSIVLSPCQLAVPPRIDSFNIVSSAIVEVRIIGDTIY